MGSDLFHFQTGKTILLKEKAKEIIIQEETKTIEEIKAQKSQHEKNKIIFDIFEGAEVDTNLKLQYEKDFEQFRKNVKVIGIQGLNGKKKLKFLQNVNVFEIISEIEKNKFCLISV